MSKRTIAPRECLRRQGNYRKVSMELAGEDRKLLPPQIERAKEPGCTLSPRRRAETDARRFYSVKRSKSACRMDIRQAQTLLGAIGLVPVLLC